MTMVQVYSVCPGVRQAGHALTGATGILLFFRSPVLITLHILHSLPNLNSFHTLHYLHILHCFHILHSLHPPPSLLPDKKMKFPQEDPGEVCGVCRVRPVEDIPRDIMDAVRWQQTNKQTESNQALTLASRSLVLKGNEEEDRMDRMQRQLDRVEAQLATLVALAKGK